MPDGTYHPPGGYLLAAVVGDDTLHLIETDSLRIRDHTYAAPCGFTSHPENAGGGARVVAVRFLRGADRESVCARCLHDCRPQPARKRKSTRKKQAHHET